MSIEENGFVFVTPVWGSYVDTFLDVCIPSLLAPGNLPSIDVPAEFLIYTLAENKEKIEQHVNFKKLTNVMKTQILIIPGPIYSSFETITQCHQLAFDYADHLDAGIFIIMPDFACSNNYCSVIQNLAKQGYRLISVPNFSVNLGPIKHELSHWMSNEGVLDINALELMQVAMRHLHQKTLSHMWEHNSEFLLPSVLFWRIANNGGLIGRYFYGCFNYVYPTNKFSRLHATMDVDYIFHACPEIKDHYACTDSEQILCLEMSGDNKFCAGFPKGCVDHIRYYAEHLNVYQIEHSKHVFKLTTGLASVADCESAMDASRQVMDGAYDH